VRSPHLNTLKARLEAFNQGLPPLGLVDLAALQSHSRDLKTRLNGGMGNGLGVPRNRAMEAVREFAKTRTLMDCKRARYVTWGLLLLYAPGKPCLMEDTDLFPRLIAEIERLKGDKSSYRRCWRGLLHAYFSYEPDGEAPANWRALRDYLHLTVPDPSGPGFIADWVAFISEHRNLLSDDPTRRYGDDLADGRCEIINEFRAALGEGDQGWFPTSLFNAQIRAITDRPDVEFKAKLPFAIDLLHQHQLLADGALAEILDRYYRCNTTDADVGLRDFASLRWGPPWLAMNAAKWGRVSENVQRMVEGWLKLDFIEKFFGLLSEDGVNDPRRLEFWRDLHEHIGDMYFALGKTASSNQSSDFKKMRQSMRGRILTLDDTTTDNNAFIMQIGGHHFVEFGETGNALRAYDPSSRPFDQNRSYISIHRLKNRDKTLSGERLIHKDTLEGAWEWRAIAIIEARTGIDLSDHYSKYKPHHRRAAPTRSTRPAPAATRSQPVAARMQVIAFCQINRLKYQDLTDRGGQFWIEAKIHVPGVTPQLNNWGFRFSTKRSAWYGAVT